MKRKTILLIVAVLTGAILIGVSIAGLFMVNINRATHEYILMGSGSMRPTLEKGDMLKVELDVDGSDIRAAPKDADPPGDIIVFPGERVGMPGELIIHRAVRKTQDANGLWHFKTQGDANYVADPGDIKETEIVGKVVEVNPPIWTYGYFSFWIPITVSGVALIVIAPIVFVIQSTRKTEVVAKPRVEGKFFCRYCGKENKPDAKYCEACGRKL